MSNIDFSDAEFLHHPQKKLFEIVQSSPIHVVKLPKIGRAYLVANSDALIDFLKSPHRFTANVSDTIKSATSISINHQPQLKRSAKDLLSKDGASHKDLRHKLDQALRKSGIKTIRPNIAKLADALLAQTSNNSKAGYNLEIVSSYARPLPALVFLELLGIPSENAPNALKWMTQISFPSGPLGNLEKQSALKKLKAYLLEFFSNGSDIPNDCLGHHLIQQYNVDETIDLQSLTNLAFSFLMSGHHTTTNLISIGLLTLLEHPKQLNTLMQDWTKAPAAIEEILRFAAPIQTTSVRYAKDNFVFHGHQFKRGDIAYGLLAASNMDPTLNPSPLEFDISRQNIRQISFGAGAHFCAGAQLAHIIAEVSLQRFFAHYHSSILFTNPKYKLEWIPRFGVRQLSKLCVEANGPKPK